MRYEITTLENGLRVVAAPMKERRSVAAGIWVHVGARDESPRLSGVSHFLEHVVFKGTGKRSADQIKQQVEGVGGSLNAFTSEEYTCFLAKCAKRNFAEVFDVLADMTRDASLREDDIRKERTVIMEEIKMTQDQPSQMVDELLTEILWRGHALGRPIAGTLETVGGMSRDEIHGYMKRYYEPGLMTVAASGDITQAELVRIARKHFGRDRRGLGKSEIPYRERQDAPRTKFVTKKTEQTHLSLGLPSFEREHPDGYALEILNVILGGNMSSRLFSEVREERGLAYEIGSGVRKYRETGAFSVDAGVDHQKAPEALKVILAELAKTARKPVPPGELKRAKDFFLGQLDLALENSMSRMLWIGESAVSLGRCRTYEEVLRRVRAVSAADIRRVAGTLFQTRALNLAVIGPDAEKKSSMLEKALRF